MTTVAKIVKEVCKQSKLPNNVKGGLGRYVWLWKGEGYWWFMYDKDGKYKTHSVYSMYLKDLSLDQWIEEGVAFVKEMEAK